MCRCPAEVRSLAQIDVSQALAAVCPGYTPSSNRSTTGWTRRARLGGPHGEKRCWGGEAVCRAPCHAWVPVLCRVPAVLSGVRPVRTADGEKNPVACNRGCRTHGGRTALNPCARDLAEDTSSVSLLETSLAAFAGLAGVLQPAALLLGPGVVSCTAVHPMHVPHTAGSTPGYAYHSQDLKAKPYSMLQFSTQFPYVICWSATNRPWLWSLPHCQRGRTGGQPLSCMTTRIITASVVLCVLCGGFVFTQQLYGESHVFYVSLRHRARTQARAALLGNKINQRARWPQRAPGALVLPAAG